MTSQLNKEWHLGIGTCRISHITETQADTCFLSELVTRRECGHNSRQCITDHTPLPYRTVHIHTVGHIAHKINTVPTEFNVALRHCCARQTQQCNSNHENLFHIKHSSFSNQG